MARYPRPLDEIRKQWAALYPATIEPAKYAKEPNSAAVRRGRPGARHAAGGAQVTKLYRYLAGCRGRT